MFLVARKTYSSTILLLYEGWLLWCQSILYKNILIVRLEVRGMNYVIAGMIAGIVTVSVIDIVFA